MEISRHNFILTLKIVICCTTLVVCLPACSSDDDSPLPGIEEDADGRALRQLTISDASLTRATIDDATHAAIWNAGDVATYVNLSLLPGELNYRNLTAASPGQTTLLQGEVYCGLGDKLALIYPSVTPATDGYYTVNLTGQKGTLAYVAERYHYVFGVAEVTKVDKENKTATGEASSMKSLLALCKFKFSDGTNPIAVKELKIKCGKTGGVDYPLSGTVTLSTTSSTNNVKVLPSDLDKGTLTITLDEPTTEGVYVALFPVDISLDFHFTVKDGSGNIYTGTAKAKLSAGKYYESTLILTKNN